MHLSGAGLPGQAALERLPRTLFELHPGGGRLQASLGRDVTMKANRKSPRSAMIERRKRDTSSRQSRSAKAWAVPDLGRTRRDYLYDWTTARAATRRRWPDKIDPESSSSRSGRTMTNDARNCQPALCK